MISRKLVLLAAAALGLLSLLAPAAERVLYQKQSAYNTVIVVEDDQGLRTLLFEKGGARQSVVKPGDPDHLELPYARVMPVGLAFVPRAQRVLIVGLGGGTIPRFLHKHDPHLVIDIVEIDPEVVHVAKRFFGFRETAKMHVYVDDGRRFIEKCRVPYDVIFLDAFGAENVPYQLATREFLESVRRALTPRGAAVGNIWSRVSNPLYDSMVRTYQDVFSELYIFDVRDRGNKILVALPRPIQISRSDLAERARTLSIEKRFPFDMGELVRYGYHRASQPFGSARILTDADEHRYRDP